MFTAAFDDAGKASEQEIFGLSGLISSEDQWAYLEREWEATLLEEGVPGQDDGRPVPFHMTDFESRQWPFDNNEIWTNHKRVRLIVPLAGIMVRRIRTRVWAVVSLRDWHQFKHPFKKDELPFALCASLCAVRVAEWAHEYGGREPVAYLFENGSQGQAMAFEAFKRIAATPLADKYYIGSRSVDDKKRPELQAADIHSYEVRKHFVNELNGGIRPQRKLFHRILDIPDGKGYFVNAQGIADWYTRLARDGPSAGIDLEPLSLSHDVITRIRRGPME